MRDRTLHSLVLYILCTASICLGMNGDSVTSKRSSITPILMQYVPISQVLVAIIADYIVTKAMAKSKNFEICVDSETISICGEHATLLCSIAAPNWLQKYYMCQPVIAVDADERFFVIAQKRRCTEYVLYDEMFKMGYLKRHRYLADIAHVDSVSIGICPVTCGLDAYIDIYGLDSSKKIKYENIKTPIYTVSLERLRCVMHIDLQKHIEACWSNLQAVVKSVRKYMSTTGMHPVADPKGSGARHYKMCRDWYKEMSQSTFSQGFIDIIKNEVECAYSSGKNINDYNSLIVTRNVLARAYPQPGIM